MKNSVFFTWMSTIFDSQIKPIYSHLQIIAIRKCIELVCVCVCVLWIFILVIITNKRNISICLNRFTAHTLGIFKRQLLSLALTEHLLLFFPLCICDGRNRSLIKINWKREKKNQRDEMRWHFCVSSFWLVNFTLIENNSMIEMSTEIVDRKFELAWFNRYQWDYNTFSLFCSNL